MEEGATLNYRATAATEQRKGTQWSGYRELYSKTLLKPEKKWPCSGQSSSSPRYSPEGKREWGLWARSSWASGKLEEAPSSICLRPSTEQKVIKQLRLQRKPWITEAPSLSLSLSHLLYMYVYNYWSLCEEDELVLVFLQTNELLLRSVRWWMNGGSGEGYL